MSNKMYRGIATHLREHAQEAIRQAADGKAEFRPLPDKPSFIVRCSANLEAVENTACKFERGARGFSARKWGRR